MAFKKEIIEKFIEDHQSHYIGKYRYHSSYKSDEDTYKNHYYLLDENFRKIDIFVEIRCGDQIEYTFSEELHTQAQMFIVIDALKRILYETQYKTKLHYTLYEKFITTISQEQQLLEPIDYCKLLYYMKYHQGINQETMDSFYDKFIPTMEGQLRTGSYDKFLYSTRLVLNTILYEYEWNGVNSKYLDTEYQYHLYYMRKIIKLVYLNLEKFYSHAKDELLECIKVLCLNPRFSFAVMSDFEPLVLSHDDIAEEILDFLKNELVLNEKGVKKENVSLIFSYLYYIYYDNYDEYYAVVLKAFRSIINNMLTFANSDLDLALGNTFLKKEGYGILIDLFHEDYNTFVFACFPISSFPLELRTKVRDELVTAIQYFAARMESDNYRLSSFEQVMNINRILMDNFKEWYK